MNSAPNRNLLAYWLLKSLEKDSWNLLAGHVPIENHATLWVQTGAVLDKPRKSCLFHGPQHYMCLFMHYKDVLCESNRACIHKHIQQSREVRTILDVLLIFLFLEK